MILFSLSFIFYVIKCLQRYRHNTYVAPQATKPAYSLGRSPSQCSWTLVWSHTAIALFCHLMASTYIIHVDYSFFPRGMGGWVGLVCWPIADSLSIVVNLSNIDLVQCRYSRPAKDRHRNHWSYIHAYRWTAFIVMLINGITPTLVQYCILSTVVWCCQLHDRYGQGWTGPSNHWCN